MKLGAVSRHFVEDMGWSLLAVAKSVGSVYGECNGRCGEDGASMDPTQQPLKFLA